MSAYHNRKTDIPKFTTIISNRIIHLRSRVRFQLVSLNFSLTQSFRPHYDLGVDSASNRNENREYFLGVKADGA